MCRPPKEGVSPTSSNNPAKGFSFTGKLPFKGARTRFGPPVTPAPAAAPAAAPALDLKDPWAKGAPDYGNTILSSIRLPSSGLATIESLTASSVTQNSPDLLDPMGELSQRVQRKKAQLSIAK